MSTRRAKVLAAGRPGHGGFQAAVAAWVEREPLLRSAVLFGSCARADAGGGGRPDDWSDLDLQVGTDAPERLERLDWARVLPDQEFRFQVVRPATGGVRKSTVLFAHGQIDLVIVPRRKLRALRAALTEGRHTEPGVWRDTLNEFHVCLRSGYRFLKGEREWGGFYADVARLMSGVRVSDRQAVTLAEAALADLLWVLQKLERGELRAAQHWLHRQVAETNFRLLREHRLRAGDPLPSFGLARRVERLLPARELAWVTIDARLDAAGVRAAAWRAYDGLRGLMRRLVPSWTVPSGAAALLKPFRPAGARPRRPKMRTRR